MAASCSRHKSSPLLCYKAVTSRISFGMMKHTTWYVTPFLLSAPYGNVSLQVEFQEEMKYNRSSGIKLGGIDFVKYAEAFGGKGFRIHNSEEMEGVMEQALAQKGLSLVDVRIDYSKVKDLAAGLIQDSVG